MAESVTTPLPIVRPMPTILISPNALIQRRIVSALSSKDNAELTQRVRRLERLAVLGTRPNQFCFRTTCKMINLYRIIYSTPELKQPIEESVGTIGLRPPIDNVGLMTNMKLVNINVSFERQTFALIFLFFILLFSGYPGHAVLVCLGGFLSACVVHRLRTQGLDQHSRCCSCGISTKDDLFLQAAESECSNCQGTGVCQVGCPSCCPYIFPKEEVVQRLDYLEMLEGNPHLRSLWNRAVDDEAIIAAQQGGGGGEMSQQEEHNIIIKSLERNPDLKQQLDAAVVAHKKNNNSGDLESNADEAGNAPGQHYSSLLDLPTVATDNMVDAISSGALLGEDDGLQDVGNLLHSDEEVPIASARLLNANTNAAGYEMVAAKEL